MGKSSDLAGLPAALDALAAELHNVDHTLEALCPELVG